jgi:hypothetical protein
LLNKASQEQKDAATASTNLSNTISSNMNSTFANSQQIQGTLNSQLNNITNAGMAGKGFLGNQETALRSASKQNEAQSNVSAEQALNQRNAGGEQGGAASSGAVAAGNERLASTAAAGDAANQLAITNQNANLARENVSTGLNGLNALSGQITGQTDALTGAANTSAGQSYSEETAAHQPSTFWSGLGTSVLGMGLNAIAPGVGTLASGVLGGLTRKGPANDDGYNGG